jgi:hypothetical protein
LLFMRRGSDFGFRTDEAFVGVESNVGEEQNIGLPCFWSQPPCNRADNGVTMPIHPTQGNYNVLWYAPC